jgi:eukaryotic-like serine/threonine-protein kinase
VASGKSKVHTDLCPSDDVLAAFSLGDLAEEVLDTIRKHQERCARCEFRARQFDDQIDPVIETIRRTISRKADSDRLSGVNEPLDQSVTRQDWNAADGPHISGRASGRGLDHVFGLSGGDISGGVQGHPANERAITSCPILPDYEIGESILGRGSMGVVYKARHLKLNRVVALKMMAGEFSRASELFQIEAKAVARLQHPNIVQIFDIGNNDGQPFLALEFVEGGSLDQRIAGHPQPARFAAETVRTLARAADYAHRQGIVHCDLKPSNILITPDGVPKIADFGVAKWLGSTDLWAQDGDIVGTPRYMAPEQASGEISTVGPGTDVYSLGVILYEMLTGRPPRDSSTSLEMLTLVRDHEPVSPRQVQPRLPRDLETIVLKSLRKEPAKRYADAKSLAEDLDRFLTGIPILARRISRVERAIIWAKQRRTALSLFTAITAFWLVILGLFHYRYSTLASRRYSEPRIGSRGEPSMQPVTSPNTVIQDDGSIRLGAAAAVIQGDSLAFQAAFGNLGFWRSTNDRATWTFQLRQREKFTLSLDYACPDSIAGNTYEATVAGAVFRGVVAGTTTCSNYRVTTIGEMELPTGIHRLEVRSAGPIHISLFDLRAVILKPRQGAPTSPEPTPGAGGSRVGAAEGGKSLITDVDDGVSRSLNGAAAARKYDDASSLDDEVR